MNSVRIALAAGLGLLAIAIGVVLLQAPMRVLRINGARSERFVLATTTRGGSFCQPHEPIPAGTSTMRLWLAASVGPRVRVVAYSHGRTLTDGTRGSGWTSNAVAIAVAPLRSTASDATICASFRPRYEEMAVFGTRATGAASALEDGRALNGRMLIEYLGPGNRSWASMAQSIARRAGLGRASTGAWIVVPMLALLLAITALTSRLLLRELP